MNGLILAALLAAVQVDTKLPAGNVIVQGIAGDTVRLEQDFRTTQGGWFYWAFRVTGAEGKTLKFRFDPKKYWAAVGSRGAAVSRDRGASWEWSDAIDPSAAKDELGDHADVHGFTYAFGPDEKEVWFSQTIPYGLREWKAFLDEFSGVRGKLFEELTLCRTKKGRDVPLVRFGRIDGKARYRAFVSSRHHCQEASATFVVEGMMRAAMADDGLGRWCRENVEFRVVPFVDLDGVVEGDQGKNRTPWDHCRDYNETKPQEHPEVAAIMKMLREWKPTYVQDTHAPWLRGSWKQKDNTNEFVYQVGNAENGAQVAAFGAILERVQRAGLGYRAADDVPFGVGWNTGKNYTQGKTLNAWAQTDLRTASFVTTFEIPFANLREVTLRPANLKQFGRDILTAWREYAGKEVVDGVYPHLAMSNDEGECGTGAVVPWAGALWVVTYGPHCPVGSSDKLYRIAPDLTRTVFAGSVGGTPANRMVHRETNQLVIGPYVIDAQGKVRTVPTAAMPGRLTGTARHLTDPANKAYVATMETGLYELDLKTLAVKTLIRENGKNDGAIADFLKGAGAPWPVGWEKAPRTHVAGYHAKGLASGFGRVYVANNGEDSEEARRNPFVPSGVLADWTTPGTDWRQIRRCQFTEITTADGVCGNEHPDRNPVWALGWDAKSVLLAVTTNGTAWAYYRLPKASHCYDGAHGWNTEWPRIREAGLGGGDLLATMHGTFWRFPKTFSPAAPNGIRPISTYLKVIGDFCWWPDAPNGGSVVFGCDDHARNEFLGKRKLKADQPKIARSTSNLWFVKPEELASFGPPSGEGWVWHDEDVKAGEMSDPYLWEGYAVRTFACTDESGRAVPCELVHEGDWVRVKALADAKGVRAHFVYGPAAPSKLPALDAKRPFVEVTDDNGRTHRFPNVNGDTTVICREVATERDLLYVGGVFYELPAENAGGFAALRPIALADEPVRTIAVDRGLIVVNGRKMVLDSLWKNGTAPAAYALWRLPQSH